MKIKVEYNRNEVEEIVLARHVNIFGEPPEGDEWLVFQSYGEMKIENCPIKDSADGKC
jgi:hypothetical protein